MADRPMNTPTGARQSRRPLNAPLRLIGTEPAGGHGLRLIFEGDGQAYSWLLDMTSTSELLALLLRGRLRKGRRVMLEADVALEPPEGGDPRPHLSLSAGPLDAGVLLDAPTLAELRRDIDRFLAEHPDSPGAS